MSGAVFTGARISDANLRGANLASATLCGIIPSSFAFDLTGANLGWADLRGVNLGEMPSGINLTGALFDDKTRIGVNNERLVDVGSIEFRYETKGMRVIFYNCNWES